MNLAVALPPSIFSATCIHISTHHAREFTDITESVETVVLESGAQSGIVVVASRHTTAAIVVNEHEPELLKDLDRTLQQVAPESRMYAHNSVPCGPEEHPNGHAHCQALFLSASTSVPIIHGRPALGRYQRIFFVELDHARERMVHIMVMGSALPA